MRNRLSALTMAWACCTVAGCWQASDREIVVYSALDAEFAEPILQQYARAQMIDVRPNFDVESTKTVGLVTRIQLEQKRPRCDVFWNNEILHTLRLEKQGLLEPYRSPAAAEFPANYRSPQGYWHGFAARARVLIVNTQRVAERERPGSIEDLVAARWRGQVAIAKPLFGTTATHASVLFASWGPERAQAYFRQLKEHARVLSGNKQVAIAVGRGDLAFGLTDTDDAIIEQEAGRPVAIVYPDQQEGGMGTLFIPNTVAILRGAPHPQLARALVDHLLSSTVETELAQGPSAQFPVNPQVSVRSRVAPEEPVRWMEADFGAAADHWDEAAAFLREVFATAE
ncbi:MAG: extracellular solute-binding protein [Pirellulaceae bacterium]